MRDAPTRNGRHTTLQRRRYCITLLASLPPPWWTLAQNARGQERRVYRVGWLGAAPREASQPYVRALENGLRERGYIPGKYGILDYRTVEGKVERLPELAAAFGAEKFDVIVAASNATTDAARRATSTIPIVTMGSSDPVALGFASSLARPGGNITGLTSDTGYDPASKPLQFLKELRPALSRVAVFRDPKLQPGLDEFAAKSAIALGLSLVFIDLTTAKDVEGAFAAGKTARVEAVLWWPNTTVFFPAKDEVISRALKDGLPAASLVNVFADDGGLLSYGPDFLDLYRRAATHVDKILKGAKPADLPIEQPTKYELVINRRTANALGIAIPQGLLVRADRLIE